jgi:hypothetical protein
MRPQEKSIDLKTQNKAKDIKLVGLNGGLTPKTAFKVGNSVTFWMYYDGEDALREGTIVTLNPNGLKDIAIVHFNTGNPEGLGEVQIPIAKIALSKVKKAIPLEIANDLPPDTAPTTPEEIEARINLLRSQGPVAPPGVWIDCTSSGSSTAQVRWKSRSPCFTSTRSGSNAEARVKSRYIGIPNSTEHKEAQSQVKRRNEILELEKKLRQRAIQTT